MAMHIHTLCTVLKISATRSVHSARDEIRPENLLCVTAGSARLRTCAPRWRYQLFGQIDQDGNKIRPVTSSCGCGGDRPVSSPVGRGGGVSSSARLFKMEIRSASQLTCGSRWRCQLLGQIVQDGNKIGQSAHLSPVGRGGGVSSSARLFKMEIRSASQLTCGSRWRCQLLGQIVQVGNKIGQSAHLWVAVEVSAPRPDCSRWK
ncbi:hypothetical protein J6590_100865 [Homalodisca vitripennis]|nr:hypothetical protein J6590_100865 [Homalodisca vitripennis]